jgi:1-acyl-sn-glycerol-3-phosphate acyltransferase
VHSVTRRLISIPALLVAAVLLVVLLPLWLPLAVLVDAIRGRWRLPIARLLGFALGWAWLETAGVAAAAAMWVAGRSTDTARHYALQRWWAANLMAWLRVTTGIRVETHGVEAFTPGPTVLLCRHASLADSLVSAWVITHLAHATPRYVLKRELLADPCLDVVGNRLPNHFLDREATDSTAELDALTALSRGMGPDDVAIIFPEGTRASNAKRSRALQKIGERDPERATRLAGLRHLIPPRPAGASALLAGCPEADVVLAWHIGFDGLDTFGGILRHLARKRLPVVFTARRIPRADVPSGDAFTAWIDQHWLTLDDAVDDLLHLVEPTRSTAHTQE